MNHKIGDIVCFKSDVEQCGRIVKIIPSIFNGRNFVLHSLNDEGFEGDYIGGQNATQVAENEVWTED